MAKTFTKNPNLWNDDRLKSEYYQAYTELKQFCEIARQVLSGTYPGSRVDVLDKSNLMRLICTARTKVFQIEKYVAARNEWFIKNYRPVPIQLVKINRSPTIFYKPKKKIKTAAEMAIDNLLDEQIKELFRS